MVTAPLSPGPVGVSAPTADASHGPASVPQAAGAPATGASPTVLFTAVRNESPFLIEWIAYHKVIGFERIIVFANASDDGTEALLQALAAAGEVEYHFHTPPERVSAQGNAARIANERGLIPDGAWTIWLDADEFLNVRVGGGMVGDLIARLGSAQGILINWRLFGDSGRSRYPGRTLSPEFDRASRRRFPENRFIKTLFRYSRGNCMMETTNAHRPQVAADLFTTADFLAGNGRALSAAPRNVRWVTGREYVRGGYVTDEDIGFGLAQVNHYAVRSPDLYLLKRFRGDGMQRTAGAPSSRYGADYYRRHNRNDVEETSILRHEAATTAEMARLRALPGVAEAEAEALHRTAAMIAAIPPEEFAALTGEPLPEAAVPRSAT